MDDNEMLIDRLAKINIRLISKFKDKLFEEYGEDVNSISKMFNTLYNEQNKIMPLAWNSYVSVSDTGKGEGNGMD